MLFDRVRRQVERLIPLFGVGRHASTILASFDELCGESMHIDVGRRTPEFSRINADGTPFQFALSLSRTSPPALQFLGEAGRPGCGLPERLHASFASLNALARACGLVDAVEPVLPMLRDLAPDADSPEAAESGPFWFALSFPPGSAASLTVYINGRWGPADARWRRLDRFAAAFGSTARWRAFAARAAGDLTPHGMAVTLRPNAPASGRIYLHAFGVHISAYRNLFLGATTPDAADAFDTFGRVMLGADAVYPTRSAVLSLELPDAPMPGAKFELCAHCAFAHDAQAAARISSWLRHSRIGEDAYRSTLASLMHDRRLSDRALPSLHAYVGVGARGPDPYASIYVNPGPALETA